MQEIIKLARLSIATKPLLFLIEPKGKGKFFDASFKRAAKLAFTPGPYTNGDLIITTSSCVSFAI